VCCVDNAVSWVDNTRVHLGTLGYTCVDNSVLCLGFTTQHASKGASAKGQAGTHSPKSSHQCLNVVNVLGH
jgi:hypothetical protein